MSERGRGRENGGEGERGREGGRERETAASVKRGSVFNTSNNLS